MEKLKGKRENEEQYRIDRSEEKKNPAKKREEGRSEDGGNEAPMEK